jgi:hypothetical protein
MGVLKAPAHFLADGDASLQGNAVVFGFLDEPFNVSTIHELGDHVRLSFVITQIEDSHDMWVGAQPPHGLSLSGDAGSGCFVQTLGLDQGEGYIPVQQAVMG